MQHAVRYVEEGLLSLTTDVTGASSAEGGDPSARADSTPSSKLERELRDVLSSMQVGAWRRGWSTEQRARML